MPENKRTQINIRLDEVELEKVKLSAEVLGLSVGSYSKKIILDSKLIAPKFSDEFQQQLVRQLSGAMSNLNQLAKHANTTGKVEIDAVDSVGKEVTRLWQLLVK